MSVFLSCFGLCSIDGVSSETLPLVSHFQTNGNATISNDGATIMKLLEVVHPAAKTLVDIARAQDAEVGDGTTSVVILCAELLRQCKSFIEEGVSPHVIMKGYRKACMLVSRNGLLPPTSESIIN